MYVVIGQAHGILCLQTSLENKHTSRRVRCLGIEGINHVRRPKWPFGWCPTPIYAYVTLAIESMYSTDDEMKEEKRKEET